MDLETLFSDLAPVRTAFVVTDAGISKGVGYVSFAAREDAERVVLDHGGDASQPLDLAGRKLRLQWADQKVRMIFPLFFTITLTICSTAQRKESENSY